MKVVTSLASIAVALVRLAPPAHVVHLEPPAIDSVSVLRSVRSAQASFETFRRSRLPVGDVHTGPCDVRIGRYCYWRGDESEEKQPSEAAAIIERRTALIRSISAAAADLPGDGWIAGQLIRYLVEADRTDDALRAADRCRADRGWCRSLGGYAAHVAARFAVADSLYRLALADLSEPERCRWLDISDLLDGDLADRYDKLDCAGRRLLAERVFWIGAPMYSVAMTDLFTEHLARVTRARIAERSVSVDGEAWADDTRALVVRYGWPRWYSRAEPVFGSVGQRSITGHDAGMPYDFISSLRAVEKSPRLTDDDWRLDDPRAPTGYAPSYARSMHDLPSQIVAFRRGDSALVVAAWDAGHDTSLAKPDLAASLVLAADGARRGLAGIDRAAPRGRISAQAAMDSGVVSLELLAPGDRRAARKRVGLPARPSSTVSLSGLLLYAAGDAPAYALDAVRDSMLAGDVVPAAGAVGVYWETYGLPRRSDAVRFTLSIEQIDLGWVRRARERLGLADPTTGLRVQWEEVPRVEHGIAGRGVRLDLSHLRRGRYRLELTVAPASAAPAVAVREIEVR